MSIKLNDLEWGAIIYAAVTLWWFVGIVALRISRARFNAEQVSAWEVILRSLIGAVLGPEWLVLLLSVVVEFVVDSIQNRDVNEEDGDEGEEDGDEGEDDNEEDGD